MCTHYKLFYDYLPFYCLIVSDIIHIKIIVLY